MSLINDALKRARDVDRKRGAGPPAMTLKPVEPAESKPASHSKWLVLAIVALALGLSLWSFSRWAISTPPPSGSQRAGAAETPVPLAAPIPRAPIEEHPLAPIDPPPELGAVADASTALAAVTHEEPESLNPLTPAEVVPGEPPGTLQTNDASGAELATAPDATPELRLQSIIYRLRNPAVIINGQLLEEGIHRQRQDP
jgi:hypothetical protein